MASWSSRCCFGLEIVDRGKISILMFTESGCLDLSWQEKGEIKPSLVVYAVLERQDTVPGKQSWAGSARCQLWAPTAAGLGPPPWHWMLTCFGCATPLLLLKVNSYPSWCPLTLSSCLWGLGRAELRWRAVGRTLVMLLVSGGSVAPTCIGPVSWSTSGFFWSLSLPGAPFIVSWRVVWACVCWISSGRDWVASSVPGVWQTCSILKPGRQVLSLFWAAWRHMG